VQDRIIAKARANASDSRGRSDAVGKTLYIHQARGLGFCNGALSGPKTLLGPGDSCANTNVPRRNQSEFRSEFGIRFGTVYSTLLRSVGTEFKVKQELLRHSSFRSTLDVYQQAVTPAKYAAQAAVISLVFSSDNDGTALVAG
jgi:hypothetical protein